MPPNDCRTEGDAPEMPKFALAGCEPVAAGTKPYDAGPEPGADPGADPAPGAIGPGMVPFCAAATPRADGAATMVAAFR